MSNEPASRGCVGLRGDEKTPADRASNRPEQPVLGISRVLLAVEELDRGVGFYRDILGCRLLVVTSDTALFECGRTQLMLTQTPPVGLFLLSSLVFFRVDDIQLSYSTLSSKGVLFEQVPSKVLEFGGFEQWVAFFRDWDWNLLGIMSERPSPRTDDSEQRLG